jgi:hypothetical protein
MKNSNSAKREERIALSRHFAKQQLWNAFAMLTSAILAYCVANAVTEGLNSIALPVAAATGFTVGVCCAPSTYRSRSGSLDLQWCWLLRCGVFQS